jgi:hypothetical protein
LKHFHCISFTVVSHLLGSWCSYRKYLWIDILSHSRFFSLNARMRASKFWKKNCRNFFSLIFFHWNRMLQHIEISFGWMRLYSFYNGYSLFTVCCTDKDILLLSFVYPLNQKTKTEQKISYSFANQFGIIVYYNYQ